MLKIILTQLAKNLTSNMAENAKVGNEMSFITKSVKNLSASIHIAKNAEIDKGDDCDDNKTVKRLSSFKKPNILTRYLTFLHSKKRWVFLDCFWLLLKLLFKKTTKGYKQNVYACWLKNTKNCSFCLACKAKSFFDTLFISIIKL